MKNKILMGASVLAIFAALPALAETNAKVGVNAETSTSAKIENKLDKAGDAIERTAVKAKAATKEAYGDVKAYFSDDNDINTVSSLNVNTRLTADRLIGATVQNPAGEDIGKIEDILVDGEGDAETVVINDGGILGLGGKTAAFDFDVIKGITNDDNIVVKLSEASIKKARRFEYTAPSTPDAKISVMPASQFSVKKIEDAKIVDDKGKNVAEVDTVAFDGDDADYVIVTFDQILGMGGDKVALDFDALDLVNNNGKYTFRMNSKQTAQFQNHKAETKAN